MMKKTNRYWLLDTGCWKIDDCRLTIDDCNENSFLMLDTGYWILDKKTLSNMSLRAKRGNLIRSVILIPNLFGRRIYMRSFGHCPQDYSFQEKIAEPVPNPKKRQGIFESSRKDRKYGMRNETILATGNL